VYGGAEKMAHGFSECECEKILNAVWVILRSGDTAEVKRLKDGVAVLGVRRRTCERLKEDERSES